jgi:hypothetical protein
MTKWAPTCKKHLGSAYKYSLCNFLGFQSNKMYFYDDFSNVPAWIEWAGLENTNTMLWHTFHERYWTYEELIKTPRWSTADRIFLVGQEGNIDHLIDHDPRIHVWDSLVKPGVDRFYSYFWWWQQAIEVNQWQHLTQHLSNPLLSNPTYVFDCMMGATRSHRDYIYDLISNDHDTKRCCLIKYHRDPWLSGVDIDEEQNLKKFKLSQGFGNLAGALIPYRDQQTANICTWVPWKIYNQSWFSVVAETRAQQNFFTEKTAKPLLAKKFFVMIGAAGALRDLRNIGIKTFDGIIDESYDLEANDQKRWNMAFEQIRSVCSGSPEDIYQQALPILEHNQNLMLALDCREQATSQMRKIVHGN